MAVDIEIPISEITEASEPPSKTYRLDLDSGRILGITDELDAVTQAIRKAVITKRFYSLIYDNDYGCEAESAVHDKSVTPEYLKTAVPEMIKDALSPDTRILDVYDFDMNFQGDSMHVSFSVDTIFGKTKISEVI